MPTAPPTICPCGGKRYAGQPCQRCGRGKRKAHSMTSGQRGYDYAWQKFRERYLAEHPLCEDCLNPDPLSQRSAFDPPPEPRVTAATELHHKRKIKDAPHLRLDRANVVGLCDGCHNRRTARGE